MNLLTAKTKVPENRTKGFIQKLRQNIIQSNSEGEILLHNLWIRPKETSFVRQRSSWILHVWFLPFSVVLLR